MKNHAALSVQQELADAGSRKIKYYIEKETYYGL